MSSDYAKTWGLRWSTSVWGVGPKKLQKYRPFLSNAGPDPLKNHRATEPAMLGQHRSMMARF